MRFAFRESRVFERRARRLIGDESLARLQEALIVEPTRGDLIPGGRGLRKIRWSGVGRGKRGGTRVIYYLRVSESVIEFVHVFAKNEASDLTKRQVEQLADALGL